MIINIVKSTTEPVIAFSQIIPLNLNPIPC